MSWLKNLWVKHKTLEEVRSWVSASKEPLDQIRSSIDKLDYCLLERVEKQKEVDRLNSVKQELVAEHSRISGEKNLFLSSHEYKSLKESISAAVTTRKKIEAEISKLFEPLKNVIGQYAQSAGLAKLNNYSQDHVDALIHDYDLSIIKHVPDMIKAVVGGKILILNSTEILIALNQLKHDHLTRLIHSYAANCKSEEKLKSSLSSNVLVKQHEQFIQQLKEIQDKIDEVDRQILSVVFPNDSEIRAELAVLLREHKIVLGESHKSG